VIAPMTATCQQCGQRFPYRVGMGHTCQPKRAVAVASGVKRPKRGSDTEAMLAAQLAAAGYFDSTEREGGGITTRECFRRQHPWGLALVPERGFTADVAFLAPRLLCEIKGLAHAAGRKKVRADVEREGMAVALGWRVLPISPEQVRAGEAVALIARALEAS